MKKIYLFRHGETDWNKSDKIKYCEENHNVFLNETGVEQAKQNALNLKDKGIQHVYTSKLKRAKQTGKILADFLDIEVEEVEGLEEHSLYDNTCIGLTRFEVFKKLGEDNKKMREEKDAFMDWRPLKCETKREARERIYKTVMNICKTTPFDIIAIASHGNALKELLRALDYEDDSRLKNCEVIEADFDGEAINIIGRFKNIYK